MLFDKELVVKIYRFAYYFIYVSFSFLVYICCPPTSSFSRLKKFKYTSFLQEMFFFIDMKNKNLLKKLKLKLTQSFYIL